MTTRFLTHREKRILTTLIVSAESLAEQVRKRANPEDRELMAEVERTQRSARQASEEVRLS